MLFILMALFLGVMVWSYTIDHVPARLGLEYDYSFGNIYNFFKWLAVSFVFFALWTHGAQIIHASFSIIFMGVFLDDAFELHEKINSITSKGLGIQANYAGVILLLGLTVISGFLIFIAWRRSNKESRAQANIIIMLMGFLIFFGGAIDTLQSDLSGGLAYGFGVIEDGLELIVASIVLTTSRDFLEKAIK